MGEVNTIVILLVVPLMSQVKFTELTVTVEGPVIIKSLPSIAMELHKIESGKFNVTEGGAQDNVPPTVPMVNGGLGGMVKFAVAPEFICLLQEPISVLPSVP